MSTRPDEARPLLCELGWHRPERLARWNDGYYFSKCTRCGQDLVRTAYGSWQVPKGFRVVWQQKPPETREEISLVSRDLETVDDGPQSIAVPREATFVEPVSVQPSAAPASEIPLRSDIASSGNGRAAFSVLPAGEPLNGHEHEDLPNESASEVEVEPVQHPGAEPPEPLVEEQVDSAPAHEEQIGAATKPLFQQPDEVATPALERPAGREDLMQPPQAEARSGLPIEEVLRHLQATELPQSFSEPVDETEDAAPGIHDTEVAPDATAMFADEAAPEIEAVEAKPEFAEPEPEAGDRTEALQPEALEDTPRTSEPQPATADPAEQIEAPDASLSPVREELTEEPREDLVENAPAGVDEPAAEIAEDLPIGEDPVADRPAAEIENPPTPEPAAASSSDWDFMAEEEEDPITSFWEDPTPPSHSAVAAAEALVEPASDAEFTLEEEAEVGPEAEPQREPEPQLEEEQYRAPANEDTGDTVVHDTVVPEKAEEPIEALEAAVEDPRALAITDSFQIDRIESIAPIPAWHEPEQPSSPPSAAPLPVAADEQKVSEPEEDTVPTFRPIAPVAPIEPTDIVATPEWVDPPEASEAEDAEERPRSRSIRLAATAAVGVAVLAVLAAVASQPGISPQPVKDAAAPARVAPATPEPAGPKVVQPRPSEAAPKANRGGETATPKRTPLPFPTLPAREQAFVTASVLQCRSAPVEDSASVRKLVRGAEVQILGREGSWVSVAHKGRQCWAAARFLSTAQPW